MFCQAPYYYSYHLSPCLYEPIAAGIICGFIFCVWLIRRLSTRRYSQLDGDEGVEDQSVPNGSSGSNNQELPSSLLPPSDGSSRQGFRRGAARWQTNLASTQFWLFAVACCAQLALSIAAKNENHEYPSWFYVLSTFLLSVAWLFHQEYLNLCSPVACYRDSLLVLFYLLNILNSSYLLYTRIMLILFPSPFDPILLDSTPIVDACLLSAGILISSAILFVSVRYHGHVSTAPVSEDDFQPSAFSGFFGKVSKIFPFVWPKSDLFLQSMIVLCMVLMVLGRVLNLLVPMQYKVLVDSLTGPEFKLPIAEFLLFVFLKLLQGSSGLVYSLQASLWIPVEQFTTREVSLRVFKHLHSLSLRWHLNRKTGEVLRVMDRGTSAMTNLLSYIFFDIGPVLVDIGIAVMYFIVAFDIYFGLIVFLTMAAYLVVTIAITEWRTKYRRTMIEMDNKTNSKAVDSLLNFETVKYYGNEEYELDSYRERITSYQKADLKSQISMRILNLAQGIVITAGLLTGGILCVNQVIKGNYNVGDFVLFIAYLQQLYGPLNWFGSYYRAINQNFIDMEKLLGLLKEGAEVLDIENAPELIVTHGNVRFENVTFSYDPKKNPEPTLKGISFEIPPGKTVALCGPSGAGKSSIMRLLFRFYDVTSGRILIDGQDISKVSQQSLRKAIGVVPQDTVLFNDTLMYNIRYGRTNATDDQIYSAAELAQIHEKVLAFPEKYETQVGERGLRLSGGEKQRIAIARTLLKDPKVILLDEATSALDTNTENLIQKALNKMTREKTTLIIAHRLSTIIHADQILVLDQGRIVERGTHEQLLEMGKANKDAIYYNLWMKQLRGD